MAERPREGGAKISVRHYPWRWILIVLLGIAALALNVEHARAESGAAQKSHGHSGKHHNRQSIAVIVKKIQPYNFPKDCSKPESKEEDQLCLERRASEAAEEQAKWARNTFWVGLSGTVLIGFTLGATGLAARAARRAANATVEALILSKKEFTTAHRPKLRIRNIIWTRGDMEKIESLPEVMTVGDGITGQFYIANVGDTVAEIVEVHFMLLNVSHPLAMHPLYEKSAGNAGADITIIPPGAVATAKFKCPVESDSPRTEIPRIALTSNLYAMGWVQYADSDGTRRRTTFCRQYNPGQRRFELPKNSDPDYEAED